MGVHMPTLRDADRGIESGGSLPSWSVPPGLPRRLASTRRNCISYNRMKSHARVNRYRGNLCIDPRRVLHTPVVA